ncbi:uncharacterized protein LOC135096954 isoform X3 [Scylla paramamosain]|uniref:uncharacterized protein LOC135096954 isoform X3 n=1 Tax=Scylla paramamosain TaxID=85552 RepID=UPI003082F5B0
MVAEASRAALQAATAAAAATQAALKAAGTAAAASGDSSLPAAWAEASSIADRLQALLAPPLTAEDLHSLTQPARGLVEAGLVFAVHDVKGKTRHARISLEDGSLYLHSLQAQALPNFTATLQMGKVVPAAPPCEVFLDLAWPGSAARRVVVSLPQDTPRGRQFMLLCSGQRGACYANTRLFNVMREGQPGECVVGGDYQTGDGRGGAALLPHLDQGSRCCGSVAVVRAAAVLQRGQHSSQETKTFKNMGHGLHTSSAPLQGHDHVAEHQGK